jgi:23S rRNA pseudouridine2605 synthase
MKDDADVPPRQPGGIRPLKPRQPRAFSTSPRPAPLPPAEPVRLNRYVAQAGVCSRREADVLIREGRVRVNGRAVTELGVRVQPGDQVEVNGRRVSPRPFVYLLLNKPADTITTTDDERGRKTVLDLIDLPPAEKEGLFPVGRLDRDTQGVLLLTNDGELSHRLMHPSYQIDKLYRVRTRMPVKPDELARLRDGVLLDDGMARADQVAYVQPPDLHELGLLLHEGRNRQIRRMLEAIGHLVERLERVGYAGLTTEGLRRGKWRRLLPHEVTRLYRLVKLKR